MLTINDLKPGDRVRLIDFGSTNMGYRRRLLFLGLTHGVELLIVRFAPMGCPVQLEVHGTSIILRKEEACHLQWERV